MVRGLRPTTQRLGVVDPNAEVRAPTAARLPRCRRSYRDRIRYSRRRPGRPRGERDRPPRRPRSPLPTRSSSRSPPPTAAGPRSRPGSSTTRSSPSRRASSPPASSPATRSASCARRATSGRSSTSPRGSPARCSCRSTRRARRAGQVEPRRLRRHRAHPRDARPLRALRRGAPELPAIRNVWQIDLGDLDKLAASAPSRRRRDRAAAQPRRRLRHRDAHLHLRFHGQAQGLRAHTPNFVELCRNSAVALKEVVSEPGASTLLFITTAHIFARSSPCSRCTPACASATSPTRSSSSSLGSFKPTFLLAVPRVFEKVYNVSEQKAEAGGKGKIFRAAADTAVAYSTAKEAGKVLRPQGQVHPLRPARLRQAPSRHGRQREVRRLGFGAARPASRPLLPRARHHDPRELRPHRDHGARHGQPRDEVEDRHRGPALPGVSVASPTTARSRSRASTSSRSTGRTRGDGRDLRRRLVQDGRPRVLRQRRLPLDHRSQEGDHRHGGRQERGARRSRDPIRANPLVGQVVVVGDEARSSRRSSRSTPRCCRCGSTTTTRTRA